jgi:hypothetical protein
VARLGFHLGRPRGGDARQFCRSVFWPAMVSLSSFLSPLYKIFDDMTHVIAGPLGLLYLLLGESFSKAA